MPDLVELVTAALRNADESPWLPGLAVELAERCWINLYNNMELKPSEYGTVRVIARSRSAPRQIISVIPAALCNRDPAAQVFQIEVLDQGTARPYEESGVKFYSEDEIYEEKLAERIVQAVNILKGIPTLFMTVTALVRSIHLIDAGDDDYDVSFSEPHLPFSIFISVPRNDSPSSAIRIAEAIVHEAMHLQLTLVECVLPLVLYSGNKYYSPWKREHRTTQGVLHALYVFRVIDRFLEGLSLTPAMINNVGAYQHDRRIQISNELKRVKYFRSCSDLSQAGASLVHMLLSETKPSTAGK
jgi:HEXXH motif-containing protein